MITQAHWIRPPVLQMSEYDADKDEIEIEGIIYSGMLFRSWGMGEMRLAEGRCFRIAKRQDEDKTLIVSIEHEPRTRIARAWAAFWRQA